MNKDDCDFAALVQGSTAGAKAHSDDKNYRQLFGFSSVKSLREEDHSLNFVISSDCIDRDGEIVTVAAVAASIKGFARNPVCLAGHTHKLSDGKPPVVGSWDVSTYKRFKHHSEMRLRFAVDTDLGEQYWQLYRNNHMRAVSLGFSVKDSRVESIDGRQVNVINEIELFEISCVSVPANPDALSKSKQVKKNFVASKIEAAKDEKAIAEILAQDPDFDRKAEEFVDYLLDHDFDEEEESGKEKTEDEIRNDEHLKAMETFCRIFGIVEKKGQWVATRTVATSSRGAWPGLTRNGVESKKEFDLAAIARGN